MGFFIHRGVAIGQQAMTIYLSRICWNSNGWLFPSGEAKHLEKESFVVQSGFGHEEWLLNFAWLIGGQHYAYLQPVGKSFDSVAGQTIEILLYSINPKRQRVYVGEIHNCEVLTRSQAKDAFTHYKRVGWLRDMNEQLREIDADLTTLDTPLSCFNIRFQPTDFERYVPFRLAAPRDSINKTSRYTLMVADSQKVEKEWRRRLKGSNEQPKVGPVTRSGYEGGTFDPIEKKMQGELLKLLQDKYGKENVFRETDDVDLTVTDGANKLLVEIKSDGDARLAIRKALGQVLEYAYFNSGLLRTDVHLLIIAPGPVTPPVTKYVQLLKEKFGIPMSYATFALGDDLPSVF